MALQREHDFYSEEQLGAARENNIPSDEVVELGGEVAGARDCEQHFMQGLSPTFYEESAPVPESDQPSVSVPQAYITPGSPEHDEPDVSPESPVDDVERSSQAADGRSRNGSPVEARGLTAEEIIIHPDPAEPCTPRNQAEPIPNNGPREREHRRGLSSSRSRSRSSRPTTRSNRPRPIMRGCQNCCRTAHDQLVLMSNACRLMVKMLAVYSDHN